MNNMFQKSPKLKVNPKALGLIIIVLIVGIFIFLQLSQLPSGQLKIVDRASQLAKPIPAGTPTDDNDGYCEADEEGSEDCTCPDDSPLYPNQTCGQDEPSCPAHQFENSNGECENFCADGLSWSDEAGQCVSRDCPYGEAWRDGEGCVPGVCPHGQYWVAELRRCIRIDCPEGQSYNVTTSDCELIICNDGYRWNEAVGQCEAIPCP